MTTSFLHAAGRSLPVAFSLVDADMLPEHLRSLAGGAPHVDAGRGARGVAWPCAELRRRARSLALGLQAFGVRRGDVVMVVSGVRPQVLEAWHAIVELGAIFRPVNPGLSSQELVDVIADAGAATVIADTSDLSVLLEHRSSFAADLHLIGFDVPADDDGPILGFDALRLSAEPHPARVAPQSLRAPAGTSWATINSEGSTLRHHECLTTALVAKVMSLGQGDRYGLLLPLVRANAQIVHALVLRLLGENISPAEIGRIRLRPADAPSGPTELRG
ncbi:AMP-binding protein [Patulibacter minatonensis]|uniref:AMP-binding protein n=1 Tax=Patulibacter minatonensis TaxID=298163 RepID=UPI00047C6FF4|nr:AMP-binding protein [Patulibacter minatonensis]